MATAQKLKYIAEGFHEDSVILLNEFVDLNTVKFSAFACLWRKHHFSLIFMGRPDHVETSEFVNEIFRITSQYLVSPSFYQQVGAVYMLYGLFRNQISHPPVKIRIETNHLRVIQSLRDDAVLKEYKALHYVIDYLLDHAFLYVANQTLKGPLIGNMPKTSKHEDSICNLKTNYKSDAIKYSVSTHLAELRDLQLQYIAEKENLVGAVRGNLTETNEIYDEVISELRELVNPKNKKKEDVGDRRSKIKAEAFMRKSKNRFGVVSDDEVEIDDEIDPNYGSINTLFAKKKVPLTRRPRRPPKEERRVGRPSIKPKKEPPPEPRSDDEVDISHLLPQQKELFLPPLNDNRKLRTLRDAYYQLSPRREDSDESEESEESDSDSDDPN